MPESRVFRWKLLGNTVDVEVVPGEALDWLDE
jgi:hypothetical protein